MAITINTYSLSTNAKYIVYSSYDTSADCGEIVDELATAIVALGQGWSRHDSAGAGSYLGSGSNATAIIKRNQYDNASSSEVTYLTMSLAGSNFYFYWSAGQSDNTSAGSYTNPATAYNWNYSSSTDRNWTPRMSSSGGTIWIFNNDHGLVLKFLHSGLDTGDQYNTLYFGEWNSDFGEPTDSGYIHKGVSMMPGQMMYKNGAYAQVYNGAQSPATNSSYQYKNIYPGPSGSNNSMFALTEYPISSSANTNSAYYYQRDEYTTPAGCPNTTTHGYYTLHQRMHWGWVGWTGYEGFNSQHSPSQIFYPGSNYTYGGGKYQNHYNNYPDGMRNYVGDGVPIANSTKIAIYEPILSVGTMNGYDAYNSQSGMSTTYTGPHWQFALLGKLWNFKVTGPHASLSSGGYQFLDTGTFPIDANGFYDSGGTDTAHWCVPFFDGGFSMCLWMEK
jgi:hypothetical protein